MSGFTITAGVSFSGGFTMTDAPAVQENTAAWFGGGTAPGFRSTVARITFATDTATASVRGPLSLARRRLAAAGNLTDGWFGGGTFPVTSTVDRITYATDTATASVRGPLSQAKYGVAAAGNTDYAWFGGGYNDNAQPYNKSTVDRITYATDTATASVRGTLSYPAGTSLSAAAGNETDGWFGGGNAGGVPGLSAVERITYATDTATASIRGPLSVGRRTNLGAAGNTTNAWFGGGSGISTGPGLTSTVDRITYATDTATASVRGPLSSAISYMAAAGNSTDGWFGGGAYPGGVSIVQRITYATDTAATSTRGPLSAAIYELAAAGGIQ